MAKRFPTYETRLAYGESSSYDAIKADVLRRITYRAADLMSAGIKLLPIVTSERLEEQWEYPGTMVGAYPVATGAVGLIEKIMWTTFNIQIYQAQVRYLITDDAILREHGKHQRQKSALRAAEALADLKDNEILEDLVAGCDTTSTVTVAAGKEWDSGNADADPEDNVIQARTNILTNSNIRFEQLNTGKLLIPTGVYGALEKLRLISNETRSLKDYFQSAFNMEIVPTRDTTNVADEAYLIIHSDETAIHMVLKTNKIPLVENIRVRGAGDDYLIRQYFGTKVIPLSSSETTSTRIAQIDNVLA